MFSTAFCSFVLSACTSTWQPGAIVSNDLESFDSRLTATRENSAARPLGAAHQTRQTAPLAARRPAGKSMIRQTQWFEVGEPVSEHAAKAGVVRLSDQRPPSSADDGMSTVRH